MKKNTIRSAIKTVKTLPTNFFSADAQLLPKISSCHGTTFFSRPRITASSMLDDQTAPPFDCYKLLTEMASTFSDTCIDRPFKNTMVVAVQHLLETTHDMFRVLHQLGLERAIIGGKSYSTHFESAEALKSLGYTVIPTSYQLAYGRFDDAMQHTVHSIWNSALEEMKRQKPDLLIILDDGGDLIRSTPGALFNGIPYKPNRVVAIEQTRGGSNLPWFSGMPFAIINVAGSYIKSLLEYPAVAEIIAERTHQAIEQEIISHREENSQPVIGVIGYGTMGKAIVNKFQKLGYPVSVYDAQPEKIHAQENVISYPDPALLISSADIIIGCTGTDVTANPKSLFALTHSRKPKYLISTSSKDWEFNSLLTLIQHQTKTLEYTPNPHETIEHINYANSKLTILRGGFPLNFDNSPHSVPPEKIWPTRAALLGATLMAARGHAENILDTPAVLQLDAEMQQLIFQHYLMLNGNYALNNLKDNLTDIINSNSDTIKEICTAKSEGEKLFFKGTASQKVLCNGPRNL